MMNLFTKKYSNLSPNLIVALWLFVWWVLNLLQAGCSQLSNDEAYYHMFAQNLDWGYFDHPPLTALLVWLGERCFGGEMGVRVLFTILQPLYLWVLWLLVRQANPSKRESSLFVMLSATTLMLQLYGFIAVPDGPLMFTTALFLWAFKYFSERKKGAWVWLGVSMALMAYAKYHGALVVIFALAFNWKLLKNWRLYVAGGLTLLLLVPHLWWQYQHDWASFAYHLADRNSEFDWEYITSYILNILVVFNPFFVPLYVQAWRKYQPEDALQRIMRWMPVAFVGFFLLSSMRGYVQPQWVIVGVFGWVAVLLRYGLAHRRTYRYMMLTGWVTLALVGLVRLEMIFNPIGMKFDVFDNPETYGAIYQKADGRPVIFSRGYAVAAQYNFYTGGETYCQPNIFYRTHHWQFRDDDTQFIGRKVLLEVAMETADSTLQAQSMELANGRTFTWQEVDNYRPLRKVEAQCEPLPKEVSAKEVLQTQVTFRNPYPYDIEVGEDVKLYIVWKHGRFRVEEFDLGMNFVIPREGDALKNFRFEVPESLAGADFKVGFVLREKGRAHWFQGKSQKVKVRAL